MQTSPILQVYIANTFISVEFITLILKISSLVYSVSILLPSVVLFRMLCRKYKEIGEKNLSFILGIY